MTRLVSTPEVAERSGRSYNDDDLLTVAIAARVARRSVRTIRRAYLSGRMVAHRDGNGRGVTIRYGDLRAWLTAELVAAAASPPMTRAIAQVARNRDSDTHGGTGNMELLTAARRRRSTRPRAAAAFRPAQQAASEHE